METTTRYDVTRADLVELLDGTPNYRVEQVWRALYEQCTERKGHIWGLTN